MIQSLLTNSKTILTVFVILVFALGGIYTYYIKNQLINEVNKYAKLNLEYEALDKNFDDTLVAYENLLKIERAKIEFQTTALKEKEKVIKASEKVKQEVIKRGEIKDETNSDFTITKF